MHNFLSVLRDVGDDHPLGVILWIKYNLYNETYRDLQEWIMNHRDTWDSSPAANLTHIKDYLESVQQELNKY
jgi:UV DNA damage repair endonuclease